MKTKKILRKRIISFIICCMVVMGLFTPVGKMDKVYANSAQLEQALQWAVAIANDNSHGYSQTSRWGPDYDCSSLVISALKNAGFDTGGATYTGNMKSNLTVRGFQWIPWSSIGSASNLKRGDILLNQVYHTAFYLGNNQVVEGHGRSQADKNYDSRSVGVAKTLPGDQNGQEIRVTNYYWYSHGWDGILRYNAPVTPQPSLNTPQLSLSAGTNSYECGQNIAFNWTWGGSEADGYNLFIAKHIEGTVEYDWNKVRRVFIPGNASTTTVVDSSVFASGGGYAAYMQACAPNDKRSGQSNFVYFTVKKGTPQWRIWISRSKMGDETEVVPVGKPCYLCYQIIDKDTQKNWDERYQSNYNVKETFTIPNGKTYSYTYTNDNNWFSITPAEAGKYKGMVEVSGDFEGKKECNIIVKKFYYGDINADDDITPTDLAMAKQAVSNKSILTADQKKRADVNADGTITDADVDLLAQFVVGAITEFPAESHVHSYSSKVTKKATCTSAGVRTYSCACGESYTTTIPATVHVWDAGRITKQPTATMEGTKTYTCSVCGAVRTEQIPASGIEEHDHSYTSRVTREATCTREGERTYTCACGDSYTEKIEEKQHTVVVDKAREATCTKVGRTEGSHCSVCGTVITAQQIVAATGHVHTEVRNAKTATTLADGYTGDTYCKDCGAKLSSGKIIERIHDSDDSSEDKKTDEDNKTDEDKKTDEDNKTDEDKKTDEDGKEDDVKDEKDDLEDEGDDIENEEDGTEDWEDEEDDALEIGDMVYDASGKAEYEVIRIAGDTVCVSYNATLKKKQKVVTVPNQIKTEEGIVCKVMAVSDRAFYNNKYVKQIVLGSNITKIGARAFTGCRKLSSLTIKSKKITAKSLSSKAFKGISAKTKIKVPKAKKNFYKKLFSKKGLPKKVKLRNL